MLVEMVYQTDISNGCPVNGMMRTLAMMPAASMVASLCVEMRLRIRLRSIFFTLRHVGRSVVVYGDFATLVDWLER